MPLTENVPLRLLLLLLMLVNAVLPPLWALPEPVPALASYRKVPPLLMLDESLIVWVWAGKLASTSVLEANTEVKAVVPPVLAVPVTSLSA